MFIWTHLLLVLGVLTPALCCDWLSQYCHLSNNSLNHIRRMGSQLTDQTDQSPVFFPSTLYTDVRNAEVETQLVFIRDSLEQIFCLYRHDNLSSAAWDTKETDNFLSVIDRQIKEVNGCVLPAHRKNLTLCHRMSTNKRTDNRLRKYYKRLRKSTLESTGGSAASWELIRKETELHLMQLDLLVALIRASDPASRRRSTPAQQQH